MDKNKKVKSNKKTYLIFIVLGILLLLIFGFIMYELNKKTYDDITNFEECAAVTHVIIETYPEQCQTPDGKLFVNEKQNLDVVCTDVCVPMWEVQGNSCVFTDCGSGCGADNINSFNTEEECLSIVGDQNTGVVCTDVCVPMWEVQGNSCLFTDCGSGCGVDNINSFKTLEECSNAEK